MKWFSCDCGNLLFLDNVRCESCGKEVGWCPQCRAISPLLAKDDGSYRCGHDGCATALRKCMNYAEANVCNRCLDADAQGNLCDCCRFNGTIPDLSVEGNHGKWARMEAAKRRLFYTLDLLGLPYGTAADEFDPPLSFDFMGDELPDSGQWRSMDEAEQVFTGHAEGKITINIKEADHVEREKLREQLGESQRTIIGHFRHEIGHYYWDLLVKGRREEESVNLFGNHENPTYQAALERHYAEGPPADWRDRFVSAYATMHPWEDFAETFALYLETVSVLDTAANAGIVPESVDPDDFDAMVDNFSRIGLVMNEMNREMGLLDYTPVVLVEPVREKLRFIHDLVSEARKRHREVAA